jgi:hypothetical protein
MPSIRLLSAGSLTVVLLLGTAFAFLPFWLGGRSMRVYCESVPLGLTAAQVRDQAAVQGYEVSYEEVFSGPRHRDEDGGLDDGGADGGADAGDQVDAGALDAGPKTVAGAATIDDPRYFRPRCQLSFDDAGVLRERKFRDD